MKVSKKKLSIASFTLLFLFLVAMVDYNRVQSESMLSYVFVIVLTYFAFLFTVKRHNFSLDYSSPILFYPPLVFFYFLFEPIFQFSLMSTSDPQYLGFLVFCFILFFMLGCFSTSLINESVNVKNKIKKKIEGGFSRTIDKKLIFWFAITFFLSAFLVNVFIISKLGFLPARPDFEKIRTELPQYISGYFTYVMYLSVPATLLFFAVRIKSNSHALRRWCLIFGLMSLILPLHTGNRTRFLLGLITSLLLYWDYNRKWPKPFHIVFLLTFGLAIMGLIGGIRLSSYMDGSIFELALLKLSTEFGMGANNVDVMIRKIAIRGDFISLDWLFAPFASILPGRDIMLGRYLKETFNLQFVGGGITPTIIGSFYIYGGSLAVCIGSFMYGNIQTQVYYWYHREINASFKYWKGLLFYFNIVLMCVMIKNGFFISIEAFFYFSILVSTLFLSKRNQNK